MAISLSVDVRYHLSMAEGGYGTPLKADVDDVAPSGSPVLTLMAKSRNIERASLCPLVVGVFQNSLLDVTSVHMAIFWTP